MAITILKKMSLAGLNNWKKGVLKAQVEASDAPIFVGRILGIVRGQESVPTPFGAALKFKGEFRGYGQDGNESMAVVCYLPSPFDQMLSDQVNEIQGSDATLKSAVEFGLDVFAVVDKGETGYKFMCQPLKEAAPSDPLKALVSSFEPLKIGAAPAAPALGHDKAEDEQVAGLEDLPEAEAPASTGKKGK